MKEFNNDFYKIEVSSQPGCKLKAKIFAKPEEVISCHKRALKKLKKEISIPGFRKGKIPEDILLKKYPSQVTNELSKILLESSYNALLNLSGYYPLKELSFENLKIESFSLESGANISINFEHYPIVPDIVFPSLESLTSSGTISDKDIEERLSFLQFFLAQWSTVTRPIKENDYVILSLKVLPENASPYFLFEKKRFKVSKDELETSFFNKILGAKKGDSIENSTSTPEIIETLQAEIYSLIIEDVLLPELPEINDDFAKRLKAESLEDLKNKVSIQLKSFKELSFKTTQKDSVKKALANSCEFDLPESLFQNKVDTSIRQKLINLRVIQDLSDEELDKQKSEIKTEIEKNVSEELKIFFIIKKIFSQEGLSYSSQELQEELEKCSQKRFYNNPYPEKITDSLAQEILFQAKESLIEKKVLEKSIEKMFPILKNP